MSNEEFCEIITEFEGQLIDDIRQIAHRRFTGNELKEFADHVEAKFNIADLGNVVVQFVCDKCGKPSDRDDWCKKCYDEYYNED